MLLYVSNFLYLGINSFAPHPPPPPLPLFFFFLFFFFCIYNSNVFFVCLFDAQQWKKKLSRLMTYATSESPDPGAQMSVLICAVWSGHSLFVDLSYYNIHQFFKQAVISLRECILTVFMYYTPSRYCKKLALLQIRQFFRLKSIDFLISVQKHVVGTHYGEALLLSIHNNPIHGEIWKILSGYPFLSGVWIV